MAWDFYIMRPDKIDELMNWLKNECNGEWVYHDMECRDGVYYIPRIVFEDRADLIECKLRWS